MLRWVNTVARSFGFLWVGLLAFVFYPPPGGADLAVQAAGYAVAGLGLAGAGLCWTACRAWHRTVPGCSRWRWA